MSAIVGLFTSRYTIEALGISDYGLYSIVGGVVTVFTFINTIMVAATYRFLAFEMGRGEDGEVNKVFNICFNIHAVLAVLVLILNEIVGVYYVKNFLNVEINQVENAVFVLRLSALATFFSILSIPHQGLLTANENFLFKSIVEIIRSLLGLGIALYLLVFSEKKFILFAILIAFANLIPSVLYYIYCRIKYFKHIEFRFYGDITKYKEVLSFTGWNIIGAASVVGQNTGTPIIINSFFGTTMNAAFSIGNQVKSIISQFASNLAQAAVPQITKNYSSGNTERSINIVSYTSKYTWFLMLFPALPILLETNYLLNLWLVEVPDFTVSFTRLLLIFTLVNGLGNGIGAVIQATGKIKIFQLVLSSTTLVGLPIGYYFYSLGYNPNSIVYVFIATTLVNAFLVQILLNKLLNFNVKNFIHTSYLRILYVAISVIPLFFLNDLLVEGFPRFIIISTISIIWLLFSIYFLGINRVERSRLNSFVCHIKSKFKNATFS